MQSGTVAKTCVHRRRCCIDSQSKGRDHPSDQGDEIFCGTKRDIRPFEGTRPLDPHIVDRIHKHITHSVIGNQRLEGTQSDESVDGPVDVSSLGQRRNVGLHLCRCATQCRPVERVIRRDERSHDPVDGFHLRLP